MIDLSILDSSVLCKVLHERRNTLPSGKIWLSDSIFLIAECEDHYTCVSFKKNNIQYQIVIVGKHNPSIIIYISNMKDENSWKWMHEHLPTEVYWDSYRLPSYVISEESFFQYSLCKDMKELTPVEFMQCYKFCKTFNTNYPYVEDWKK